MILTSNRASNTRANPASEIETLHEMVRDLIESSDPLEKMPTAIIESGYAGDTRPTELAYVSLSSRLQKRTLNLHYIALSSSGKNITVKACRFVSPEAYYTLDAGSPRALVYNQEGC